VPLAIIYLHFRLPFLYVIIPAGQPFFPLIAALFTDGMNFPHFDQPQKVSVNLHIRDSFARSLFG